MSNDYIAAHLRVEPSISFYTSIATVVMSNEYMLIVVLEVARSWLTTQGDVPTTMIGWSKI